MAWAAVAVGRFSSAPPRSVVGVANNTLSFFPRPPHGASFSICPCPSPSFPRVSPSICRGKKKDSYFEQVLKQRTSRDVEGRGAVEEDQEVEVAGEEGGEYVDEVFEDEMLIDDDDDFEDDFEEEDTDLYVGDGGAGGGVSLAGTLWDKEALAIAEEVSMSFEGDLKIYAFKTSANSTIRLRLEKLSNKYGSPSMTDIEEFSSAYQARLDQAENAGTIPKNISLEVSSPGVERIVRIPGDLERFNDRPMYVKYVSEMAATASSQEGDGVFRLVSFDMDAELCTWGLADVRINREQSGKGRPLSKKQREWRLQTPFDSLRLVRLYSEC